MKTMLDTNKLKNPGKQVTKYGDYTIHTHNNILHNDSGPAVVSSFSKEWFVNGKRHRDDGPAIMYLEHPQPRGYSHGKHICEWYTDGEYKDSAQIDSETFDQHWNGTFHDTTGAK
jgi:hypothetical protein